MSFCLLKQQIKHNIQNKNTHGLFEYPMSIILVLIYFRLIFDQNSVPT